MVGMLVRDEDVTETREWHSGERELPGDSISAIDHIGDVVGDDHLG